MKKYSRYHIQQLSPIECGISCLKSIVRYFGSDVAVGDLRKWTKISPNGTSLLDLLKAGREIGLAGKGLKANTGFLQKIEHPCILHIVQSGGKASFVVCYAYDSEKKQYWIGDPEKPAVSSWSEAQLQDRWVSGGMLTFQPSESFQQSAQDRISVRHWIFQLIGPHSQLLKIVAFLGSIVSLISLSIAFVVQYVIDQNLLSQSGTIIGIVLLLFTLRACLKYVQGFFLLRQHADLNATIGGLLHNATKLSASQTGSVGTLLRVDAVERSFARSTGDLITNSVLLLSTLIAILFYNWMVFSVCIVGVSLAVYLISKQSPAMSLVRKRADQKFTQLEHVYAATSVTAPSNGRMNHDTSFENSYRSYQSSLFHVGRVDITQRFFIDLVGVLCLGIAMYIISTQYLAGATSLGVTVALSYLTLLFGMSISNLFREGTILQDVNVLLQEFSERRIPSPLRLAKN